MATLKTFFSLIMLALQILCLGVLAHAILAKESDTNYSNL